MAQQTIRQLFNADKTFSIPHYQRDYAWQVSNFEDLWEDLIEAHDNKSGNQGHFLGTIVTAPNPDDSRIIDIIDGQQRSTTLFLLRYYLYHKAGLLKRYDILFFNDKNQLTLQVAPSNRDFFRKLIEKMSKDEELDDAFKKEAETKAQGNLFAVANAIIDKLKSATQEAAKGYLDTLNDMIMLELDEQDSGRAIRLFQTVNDRGVSLGILDKLKSLLILHSNKYCEGALDQEINERFGKLFQTIEKISSSKAAASIADKKFKEKTEERIFHYHTLDYDFGDYTYGADKAYSMLKKHIRKILETEKHNLQQWLDDYSSDLLKFAETFLELIERTKTDMELFKLFFILKIKPLFYPTLVRLEMNKVLDEECLRLIGQADIVFYKLDSTHEAKAYWLIYHTSSKEELKQQIIKESTAKDCITKHANLKEAVQKNIVRNAYDWKGFYYVFFTYHQKDISLSNCWSLLENGREEFSITQEHIVPQNTAKNGMLEQYGFQNEDDLRNHINTFGNILSLEAPLNSAASDARLINKQEIYQKSKIQYNRNFANNDNFLSFGKAQIIERNEKILQWLTEDFFKDFI